jgi:hypothetical protein
VDFRHKKHLDGGFVLYWKVDVDSEEVRATLKHYSNYDGNTPLHMQPHDDHTTSATPATTSTTTEDLTLSSNPRMTFNEFSNLQVSFGMLSPPNHEGWVGLGTTYPCNILVTPL